MQRSTTFLRILLAALLVGSLAVPGGCSWIDAKQRELIFRPVKGDWRGYNGESDRAQMRIPVGKDGDEIVGWWLPSPVAGAPAMLYLHGARWNLTGSSSRIARYRHLGFSVLAIDYRGFGKSSGDMPSEEMVYEDARAAWSTLEKLAPRAPHYVYGHSLGGAIAIELARNNPAVAGLILESTFTSIRDMAYQYAWSWLPVELVITQRFDSLDKIPDVKAPTLFIHGLSDRLVPSSMSERLYAAATAPKRLLLIDGAGHSNIAWSSAFDEVQNAVHAFFKLPVDASDASTR